MNAGLELPVDGPQLVPQLREALVDEPRDGIAGGCKHLAIGAVAYCLEREHETLRRLLAPLDPAFGLESRVKGPIDFNGGNTPAGVLQLALLRPFFGVEIVAPGLVHPAANPDADMGLPEENLHRRFLFRNGFRIDFMARCGGLPRK